ncbi:MAG TPA: hypothetical protein VF257_13910 [Solirubrobacteraceae bacterium]
MHVEISDRNRAFSLLRDAVAGLVAQGKVAATAGVKPEMQRRSYGTFDEHRLGFANFREFVAAAEQAGVVRVTHHRPGVTHLAPVDSASPAGDRPPVRRIRRDLWEAFFDWDHVPGHWDRHEHRVVDTIGPGDQERFVAVEPISFDQQVEWMRNFAQELTEPVGEALRAVLDTQRPVQAFVAVLRTDRQTQVLWTERRLELVAEHIEQWAAKHSIDISIWQEADVSARGNLRALLHRALDAVPDDQLHLVALPAEAVVKVTG